MLHATGLHYRHGQRCVLEDVSLQLDAGEVVVLLGPNGAGKTTLLRLLSGILPLQQGSLEFDGEAVADERRRRVLRGRCGLLTEQPGLYDALSVAENLRLAGRLQGMAEAAIDRAMATLGARLGLAERLAQPAASLSKGLRQRVALLRALLHGPRLLLLDEPTSGLDPQAAAELCQAIAGARAAGCAVLLATHDLAEARLLGDRLLVLQRRLEALPPPPAGLCLQLQVEAAAGWQDWLQARPEISQPVRQVGSEQLQLQLQDSAQVPGLLAALVGAGARVHALQPQADELDARYRSALAALR